MNEKILKRYHLHLHGKYSKKNTIRAEYNPVKHFLSHIHKPLQELTTEDIDTYKTILNQHYKRNSQSRMIQSLNHFLRYIGRKDLKQPIPKQEQANKIILSQQELDRYMETSKKNPLWHLVAILQTDGLLRPGEYSKLKISNIDQEKKRFYLDDTKTGNNYIIISPLIEKAIQAYLPYRQPKEGYENYLILIPDGKYKGRAPAENSCFIKNITKHIAADSGIQKTVRPYIIKPSAITLDFDKQINPRIIQRKARHRDIRSTLIYDHSSDKQLLEHFERNQIQYTPRTDEERKRLLTDQYLQKEIDLETYKRSLDLLETIEHKKTTEVGYV